MLKFTCLCVLTMVARTLASEEVSCCPPDQYYSTKKGPGKAVCYTPGRNETSPNLLECEFGVYSEPYSRFVFNENGTVTYSFKNGTEHADVTDIYCIGTMLNSKRNTTHKYGLVCYDPVEVNINGYIMLVSVAFLILTVLIYAGIRELREDLQGKMFINLCASLAIGLCIFSTITMMGPKTGDKNLCAARGFFAYFFLIASFFWTTAISIQLMLSIRSPSSVVVSSWKKFAGYALFAWGCPLVITICMAVVNFHPGDHAKPGIGLYSCWFDQMERNQIFYWLYSVLGILVCLNIGMFFDISFFLCRNRFSSNQKSMHKYKFSMALRLFLVMGIYWIFELITTLDQRDLVIWSILNIVTCLQGLWIFLAWVVFRKRVLRALHKRGWLPCIAGPFGRYLANNDEGDDNVIEHTSVPLNDH